MVSSPGFSGLFQVAYVTRDMARAVRTLERDHGVGGFKIAEFALALERPIDARCVLKVALAWAGDHEVEVIEPVEDDTGVFTKPPGSAPPLTLHHLCMRVDGPRERWDAFRSGLEAREVVVEGGRPGMRFVFVDRRDTLGHRLEYVWTSPEFFAAFPHRQPPLARPREIA